MYEKLDRCLSCNSTELINHLICDDHSLTKESFAIMKCTNCQLLMTNPRPDQKSIGKYYEFDNYISHTNRGNNLINQLYKIVRNYTLQSKFKLITAIAQKESILDIGCGTGHFLNQFKSNNWKVAGVEPNPTAKAQSIDLIGDHVVEEIKNAPGKKFGIITMWHVLEHIHDINQTLNSIKERMSKKSRLVIALPNVDSYDQQYYKEFWAAYDIPRHLYHFTPATIEELMKYHSFELIDTKPMKFDSFYVSLLSEKYKNGQSNLFKSLVIGLKSNRWAQKHHNNYSSLIYIFKKV